MPTVAREIGFVDWKDRTRFLSKIRFPEDMSMCWQWDAGCFRNGYGSFRFNGQSYPAHRFGYSFLIGNIDPLLCLDHKCRNRKCVNPSHLEIVSYRENILRGEVSIQNYSKTFCKNGHEFTPENTLVRKEGWRNCRECHNRQRRRLPYK